MHRDCRVGGGLGTSCSILARVALALVDVDIAVAAESQTGIAICHCTFVVVLPNVRVIAHSVREALLTST